MEIIVSFKNTQPQESIKERALKKSEKIHKFLKDANKLTFVFSKTKIGYDLDLTLHHKNTVFNAKVKEAQDFVVAIDDAVDKIINQIKRYKDKNNEKYSVD